MMHQPHKKGEKRRLQALYDYEILDTLTEKEYDSITKIAAQICNVPVSLITFLDRERQWFKSHLGIAMQEMPRQIAFCNYTINDPDNVLVVPDLRLDERFSNNPLVTGNPNAVFYAGASLITPDGYVLGSICVLDRKVNNLNDAQCEALKGLAEQVMARLELQKNVKVLRDFQHKLKRTNKHLANFARIASHDMKTPLANITLVTDVLRKNYNHLYDESAVDCLELIDKSAKALLAFIDGILIKSQSVAGEKISRQIVDSFAVLKSVIDILALPPDIEVNFHGSFPKVQTDKTSLQQVFQNLITNAIKYNDKKVGIIDISCKSDGHFHHFDIADNGSGIEKEHLPNIFNSRQTFHNIDRFGNKGTGTGLATIKNILQGIGGAINVSSQKNTGSVFTVCIPVLPAKATT